jgi:hypothetical protein
MRRRRFAKQKNTEPIFAQVRQGLFSRFQYVRLRGKKLGRVRDPATSKSRERVVDGWIMD